VNTQHQPSGEPGTGHEAHRNGWAIPTEVTAPVRPSTIHLTSPSLAAIRLTSLSNRSLSPGSAAMATTRSADCPAKSRASLPAWRAVTATRYPTATKRRARRPPSSQSAWVISTTPSKKCTCCGTCSLITSFDSDSLGAGSVCTMSRLSRTVGIRRVRQGCAAAKSVAPQGKRRTHTGGTGRGCVLPTHRAYQLTTRPQPCEDPRPVSANRPAEASQSGTTVRFSDSPRKAEKLPRQAERKITESAARGGVRSPTKSGTYTTTCRFSRVGSKSHG